MQVRGNMAELTVLQVIPADGWRAMFVREDAGDSEDGVAITTFPLVCWALTEQDGVRGVVGMAPTEYGVDFVGVHRSWFGYLGPGEDVEHFKDDAKRHLLAMREAEVRDRWKQDGRRRVRRSA